MADDTHLASNTSQPPSDSSANCADFFEAIEPPPNATIWRYVDLAKFVSMLADEGLFFTSISTLMKTDGWEAAFPEKFVPAHKRGSEHPRRGRKNYLDSTFVNCWYESQHESVAMWNSYSRGAYTVAIRSSFARLKGCLSWLEWGHARGRMIFSRMKYIDYELSNEAWVTHLHPIFTKRIHYIHENEVRAVYLTSKPKPRFAGMILGVNLDSLIEAVYVSPSDPPWFMDVVKDLMTKYGLDASIVKPSVINEKPVSIGTIRSDVRKQRSRKN